jgi:hypothetical protein
MDFDHFINLFNVKNLMAENDAYDKWVFFVIVPVVLFVFVFAFVLLIICLGCKDEK